MYDTILHRWAPVYHRGHFIEFHGGQTGTITIDLHIMREDFPSLPGRKKFDTFEEAKSAGLKALDELLGG
jgi:hypothetical protein